MEFNATNRTVPSSAGPSQAQFCMICLDTSMDRKLYPINKYNLEMEFENLTGISLQGELYFVPQFCTICAQRLSNCSKLRDKCLKAYHLLLGLVEMNTLAIKTLRISNNLASSIGKKSFQPDHCDLYLIHKEQEPKVQELPHSKTIKIGIINDNNVLIVNPVPKNEKNIENEVVKPKTENLNLTDSVDFYLDDVQTDETINDKVTEVKLLHSKLTLNLEPKKENNVEEEVVEMNEHETEKMDDIISDDEFTEDVQDDIILSDTDIEIDTQDSKKVKDIIDKFMNDVMNDTDNDWDFLNDSDSDSDSKTTENAKTIIADEIKENNERFRRKLVRLKAKNPVTLEYLKQYKVTDLTHEEQLADIQKRKEKESFKNSRYKCMTCFKGALNVGTYNEHMERHTDKYGKSVCSVCRLHFESDIAMRHHVVNTHSVRYSCTSCPLVTNHKAVARTHAALHKRAACKTCVHCPKELHSKNAYLSHLRKAHPTVIVCCALCGFSFVNERGLSLHLHLKHYGKNLQNLDGPLCENCNIRFASETAYCQHLKVFCKHVDLGGRKHQQGQKDQQGQKHQQGQTPQQRQTPQQGQKHFSFYQDTNKPRKRSRERSSERPGKLWCLCDLCGKGFPSPELLLAHSQVHTGEKLFKCEICHKGFMHKTSLKHHVLNTHCDNPPRFPCVVCNKEFTSTSNRRRHMSTHQDTRPLYKCNKCNKSFTSAFGVEQHVTHVHGNVPWPKRKRRDKLKATTRRSSVATSDEDNETSAS